VVSHYKVKLEKPTLNEKITMTEAVTEKNFNKAHQVVSQKN
jgi:hypothetical protein